MSDATNHQQICYHLLPFITSVIVFYQKPWSKGPVVEVSQSICQSHGVVYSNHFWRSWILSKPLVLIHKFTTGHLWVAPYVSLSIYTNLLKKSPPAPQNSIPTFFGLIHPAEGFKESQKSRRGLRSKYQNCCRRFWIYRLLPLLSHWYPGWRYQVLANDELPSTKFVWQIKNLMCGECIHVFPIGNREFPAGYVVSYATWQLPKLAAHQHPKTAQKQACLTGRTLFFLGTKMSKDSPHPGTECLR